MLTLPTNHPENRTRPVQCTRTERNGSFESRNGKSRNGRLMGDFWESPEMESPEMEKSRNGKSRNGKVQKWKVQKWKVEKWTKFCKYKKLFIGNVPSPFTFSYCRNTLFGAQYNLLMSVWHFILLHFNWKRFYWCCTTAKKDRKTCCWFFSLTAFQCVSWVRKHYFAVLNPTEVIFRFR